MRSAALPRFSSKIPGFISYMILRSDEIILFLCSFLVLQQTIIFARIVIFCAIAPTYASVFTDQ